MNSPQPTDDHYAPRIELTALDGTALEGTETVEFEIKGEGAGDRLSAEFERAPTHPLVWMHAELQNQHGIDITTEAGRQQIQSVSGHLDKDASGAIQWVIRDGYLAVSIKWEVVLKDGRTLEGNLLLPTLTKYPANSTQKEINGAIEQALLTVKVFRHMIKSAVSPTHRDYEKTQNRVNDIMRETLFPVTFEKDAEGKITKATLSLEDEIVQKERAFIYKFDGETYRTALVGGELLIGEKVSSREVSESPEAVFAGRREKTEQQVERSRVTNVEQQARKEHEALVKRLQRSPEGVLEALAEEGVDKGVYADHVDEEFQRQQANFTKLREDFLEKGTSAKEVQEKLWYKRNPLEYWGVWFRPAGKIVDDFSDYFLKGTGAETKKEVDKLQKQIDKKTKKIRTQEGKLEEASEANKTKIQEKIDKLKEEKRELEAEKSKFERESKATDLKWRNKMMEMMALQASLEKMQAHLTKVIAALEQEEQTDAIKTQIGELKEKQAENERYLKSNALAIEEINKRYKEATGVDLKEKVAESKEAYLAEIDGINSEFDELKRQHDEHIEKLKAWGNLPQKYQELGEYMLEDVDIPEGAKEGVKNDLVTMNDYLTELTKGDNIRQKMHRLQIRLWNNIQRLQRLEKHPTPEVSEILEVQRNAFNECYQNISRQITEDVDGKYQNEITPLNLPPSGDVMQMIGVLTPKAAPEE